MLFRSIKRAKKSWKLEIPTHNKLNIKAKSALSNIFSRNNTEYTEIKIFQGEEIDGQTVYDLIEKTNCLSDSVKSVNNILLQLEEHTIKINESSEKILQHAEKGKTSKSPEVIATVKSFAKDLIIFSKRLENENKIFVETFAEGIYGYEQLLILRYSLIQDINDMHSSMTTIYKIPVAFEQAILGIEFLTSKMMQLPSGYSPLKQAKILLLPVFEMMVTEYKISKEMTLNLIHNLENKFGN